MHGMKRETLADKLWEQKFAICCSKRYHAHRMAWHQGMAYALQFVELCATSSVLLGLFGEKWRQAMLGLGAIVAGMSLVQLAGKHLQWHAAKKEAFGELMKRIPVDEEDGTEELLREIVARREEIEKDDDAGFRCLDVLCHNEECLAQGLEKFMKPLSFWQRYVGTILPLKYKC